MSSDELLDEGLMTVREAAHWLRISSATLYVLMGEGEIAWTKIGGQRRIPKRALVAYALKSMRCPNGLLTG